MINFHFHCFHDVPQEIRVSDHGKFGSVFKPAEECCKCRKTQVKVVSMWEYDLP